MSRICAKDGRENPFQILEERSGDGKFKKIVTNSLT